MSLNGLKVVRSVFSAAVSLYEYVVFDETIGNETITPVIRCGFTSPTCNYVLRNSSTQGECEELSNGR
jgi:hypothetical protein